MKLPFSLRAMATAAGCAFTPFVLPALAQEAAVPEAPGAAEASPAPATDDAAPAGAEASNELVIEEVFVTAQRKKERLQDVPIAVNVISADSLANMGLTSTEDLQVAVPGLTFVSTGPAGTPYLRGVGSNAGNPNDEPSVATYVDGVYIASSFANVMSFNNVERVEVLKGPQGTLFGRNATGGVIQIVTRDPKHDPSLEVSAGYGNYKTSSGSLYATTGLGEKFAVDAAVQAETQDEGWGRSLTRNTDTYETQSVSARSKLLFTPNERATVRLALDYAEIDSSVVSYRRPHGVPMLDGTLPHGDYDTSVDVALDGVGEPGVLARQKGASLRGEYQFDALQLVSITAYRDASGRYDADADASAVHGIEAILPLSQHNVSQELQLLSAPGARFDWVAGVYFYRSTAAYGNAKFGGPFDNPGTPEPEIYLLDGKQMTESQSAYAQSTTEIFADTKLTAGLRFTNEDQEYEAHTNFFGTLPEKVKAEDPPDQGFDEFTWRLALDHAFTNDVHSYLSYNRGIKGGGFDLLSPGAEGFDPEKLDAYELGLKTQLLDRRLRFNAAYFYYDYKNIQVQLIPAGGAGIVQTTNAAKAEIQGLDIDFQYVPFANASLAGGVILLASEYKEFDNSVSYPAAGGAPIPGSATGNDTIRTPKFQGNVTAEYRFQSDKGEFPVSLTVSYSDGYFFDAANRLEQSETTLINASAGWSSLDGKYGLTLWGANLGDEYYYSQGVPSAFGDLVSPAAPRTFGVTLRAKFGA